LVDKILKEVSITIPMIPDMELAVSKTAEALALLVDFSRDQIDEMKHAVIEACINAIEHSFSEDGKIYLSFHLYANKMEIHVSDRGKGFIQAQVEEPNLEKKLLTGSRKRGWGLKLIKNLMDDVKIESGSAGTTILMVKNYQPKTKELING
jgi:serine/threonine-protein kinase RsbW